jgi:hypothetical protein
MPNRDRPSTRGPLADVLIAPRAGGSVALCLSKGVYLDLDGSATEIVQLVQRDGVDGAVMRLAERHGLSPDTSRRHVQQVLTAFADATTPASRRARVPSVGGSARVLGQWLSFSAPLKVATAYVAGVVVVVEALVRLRPVDQAARWLRSPLVTTDPGVLPPLERGLLTDRELMLLGSLRWVQRLWLWDETCLRRALAGGWLLRRRRPGLCLGLPGSGGALAHAWLVVEGRALDALPDTVALLPLDAATLGRG